MEFNLDDLSPDQLSELNNELQQQLSLYMRHVVAIAGAYEIRTDKGVQPQKPFYYSATVIEIENEWYLLSAGHAFKEIDLILNSPDADLVRCGIDDTFLELNASPPFDFDYSRAARKIHYNSLFPDGLDYALIHLRPDYRKLLTANGIIPLKANDWNPPSICDCSTFLMAGFPEDSIESGITHHGDQYNARIKGKPNFIYISRGESDTETQFDQFVGQINEEHQIEDITGMSGGPIFCFKDADFDPYFIAGIQSNWDSGTKTTFACPISTIVAHASDFLRECTKMGGKAEPS